METLQTADCIQTRCPNCQTVFEIDGNLANSDDPRVRCGECYSIFDSVENRLFESLPDDLLVEPAPVVVESDSSIGDSFFDTNGEKIFFEPDQSMENAAEEFSDADLFSGDAELPVVEYLEESEEIPELDFNAIDPDDEQFDGTLFDDVNLDYEGYEELAEGYSVDDENVWEPEVTSADLPETALERGEDVDMFDSPLTMPDDVAAFSSDTTRPDKKGFGASRLTMVLVLILGFGGLYVHSKKATLEQSPATRPLVKALCLVTGCELASMSKLTDFLVVRRNVYTHPTIGKALVINIVFRNDAAFAQSYPKLAITMSDIRGKVVAERVFRPFEYLKLEDGAQISDISPGQSIDVSLEVRDPGEEAKSFELEFQ